MTGVTVTVTVALALPPLFVDHQISPGAVSATLVAGAAGARAGRVALEPRPVQKSREPRHLPEEPAAFVDQVFDVLLCHAAMYSIIISAMQAKKSAWTIWPRMGWDQGTCPKKPYLELL